MAKKNVQICAVPGCDEEVTNKKWQLCSKCASSMYYWNKREREQPGARALRRTKLQFWDQRLDWLYAPGRGE